MSELVLPVLSLIIFIPIVAAVIILFMNGERRDLVRGVAVAAALAVLLLSLAVFLGYNAQVEQVTANQQALLAAGRAHGRHADVRRGPRLRGAV